MKQIHADIDSPIHAFALAAARADDYLLGADLDRDDESRLLTARYLFETVLAIRDVVLGQTHDHADGSAHSGERVALATILLAGLDPASVEALRDRGAAVRDGVGLLLQRFGQQILDDYFDGASIDVR